MATLAAFEKIKKHVKELKLPWLDVHGDQDKLCEISGSQLLYEQSESEDKTFTVSITRPLFKVSVKLKHTCYHNEITQEACGY